MDQLTTRNFHTMSDGLKDVRTKIDEFKEDLKRKDAIISQLSTQQQTMQQQLAVLFAKSMGSGSTT